MSSSNSLPVQSICDLSATYVTSLLAAITIPTVLGMFAGSHVRRFNSIYHSYVEKPSFIPPRAVFKPIWILLYVSTGFASFLALWTASSNNQPYLSALTYYIVQLSFNLSWPALFFRYRSYKAALYLITANLGLAVVTASKFFAINPTAGYLMVPYLAWLVISGYANKKIWRLNEKNEKLKQIEKVGLKPFLDQKKKEAEGTALCDQCNKKVEAKQN